MQPSVTVTNPISAENYPLQPGVVSSQLAAAEKAKTRVEGPLCVAVQWGFHPVALSPWGGGMGPQARWLLEETTKRITVDLPMSAHSVRVNEVKQGLSMTLAREIARQLALCCRLTDGQ